MKTRNFCIILMAAIWCELCSASEIVLLPNPRQTGGAPIMEALKNRKSTREFSTRPIEIKTLGEILWAGFGINRPENLHRTAPSAMNSQEIDIYIAIKEGVFLYEPKTNGLIKISDSDVREKISNQQFNKTAPVVLVFVADYSRSKAQPPQRQLYAYIDTGFISQNIYLYCASEGLGTVIHELNRTQTAKLLNLKPNQEVIMAQSIGYPKE
ncbi:MAG: nitroreductase family protein [Limisphaerales bacterium]